MLSLLLFNYPQFACLVFKSPAHFTFMNKTGCWHNERALEMHTDASSVLKYGCVNQMNQRRVCTIWPPLWQEERDKKKKETWENYKKLYGVMMQPPVGVQPHNAFRDTRFCCFPINQTEVRCWCFFIGFVESVC